MSESTAADEQCELIPNGSFHDGELGWELLPIQESDGDAFAVSFGSVFDGSTYSPAFDTDALGLSLQAAAGLDDGTGSSMAEISATTTATATACHLRIMKGGGFEFQFFGGGEHSVEVFVQVDGPDGASATQTIYESPPVPADPTCELGLSVLGTLDTVPPTVDIDLGAAGIFIGDEIQISVVARTTASAILNCQWTVTTAFVVLDNFEFCNLSPHPADLDGDGIIGPTDLAILLGAWGPCRGCPADLNGDGAVGPNDLAILLGNWGSCG